MRIQGGDADTCTEVAPPASGIGTADLCTATRDYLPAAPREEFTQQPRRLNRHADSLAQDRMGLSCRIANGKYSIRSPRSPDACLPVSLYTSPSPRDGLLS